MNAMVNVPLSDIDNLRDSLNKYKELSESLLKTEKQIKLTIIRRDPYSTNTYDHYDRFGGWHRYSKIESQDNVEDVSYQGMDEIISILRKEEESKVEDKLSKLTEENKSSKKKYDENIEKKNKEIDILKGKQIDKEKDEIIESLKEELKKYDKIFESHQKHSEELYQELTDIHSRNWWRRVFNY